MPNTAVIKSPTWEWGDSTIDYGGKKHAWFEAYALLSSAKKDAEKLERNGYSAIISYGGIINGWQIHSTFGDYKHLPPGYGNKWHKLR